LIHEKTIRKIQKSLFSDPQNKSKLSPKELEIKARYVFAFHLMLESPEKKDIDLAAMLMGQFDISRAQAYSDINNVKMMWGNVQRSQKEWDRYAVTEMLREAYNRAKEKNDIKNMVYAAEKLGKYTKLDQEDENQIPYNEIVPPEIEPTGDVSVLGIKPIPDLKEKQRKLREKYGKTEEAKILEEE
jgi:hypothetical protein